ncbi:MAG: GIY-YIG nuclease family protein [Selenomonadaceae bacterium]|nr:GIY-YIG nuclease family protein [Selenomonadaceae bacterium]
MVLSEKILRDGQPNELLDMKNVIYVVKYRPNGMLYVGQTTQQLKRRMRQHIRGSLDTSRNSHLDSAIGKYGIGEFDLYVIMQCQTKDALDFWETFFIAFFNTRDPYGFNLTDGGGGTVGYPSANRRPVVCMETGEVYPSLEAAAEKAGVSDSYMCKVCSGVKTTAGGYHWRYQDDEEKEIVEVTNGISRKVICVEKKMIFDSIAKAAEWAGVSRDAVGQACRGQIHTSAYYHWRFLDEYDESDPYRAVNPKRERSTVSDPRKVICVETGEIFDSIKAAARWAKIHHDSISRVCRGKAKIAGGYHWKFYEETDDGEK